MRALAAYVLRGPLQAILGTVVFALLGMLVPFASSLSGAVVALVTLQVGARQGILVTAGAAVVLAVVARLLPFPPAVGTVLAAGLVLTLWLPVWLLGAVLRVTRSLGSALQAAALLGVVVVVAVFVLVGDPAAAWVQVLEKVGPLLAKSPLFPNAGQMQRQLIAQAPYLTGSVTALMVSGVALTLLIARGLQALLYKPGGLRDEFNQLRYARVTGFAALGLLAVAGFSKMPVIANMTIVMIMAYAFYGLAVLHGALARAGAGIGWLIGLYVAMLFALGQMVLVLALVGLADTWLDFRSRVRGRVG